MSVWGEFPSNVLFLPTRKELALFEGVATGVDAVPTEAVSDVIFGKSNDGGAKILLLAVPLTEREMLEFDVDLVKPEEFLTLLLDPRRYDLRTGTGRGELVPDFDVLTLMLPDGDDGRGIGGAAALAVGAAPLRDEIDLDEGDGGGDGSVDSGG